MNAQQSSQDFAAAQQLDGAEYLVHVLEGGAVVYTEIDDIVLDI